MDYQARFQMAILSFLLLVLPAQLIANPEFTISEVFTEDTLNQTIISAYLNNSEQADLISISVSEEFERSFSLYQSDGMEYFEQAQINIPFDDDIIFIDVGRYQQSDALIIFTSSTAFLFDPYTNLKTPLIELDSIYKIPNRAYVPQMNLFYDLNNDGLDDFFIPSFMGVNIFIQQENGEFSSAMTLDLRVNMEMSSSLAALQTPSSSYRAPESYFADLNIDGLDDLVFWVDGYLHYFAAREDGSFDTQSKMFTSSVPFEFGNAEEVEIALEEDPANFQGKVLYQLDDLNSDQITDLIVQSTTSESLLNSRTTFEIYYGLDDGNGLLKFLENPSSEIVSDGIQFDPEQKDFNSDGEIDFMVPSVKISIGKIVKALLTGSVKINLSFYQMIEDAYPSKPNLVRSIKIDFDLGSGEVFFPVILIEDFDNDGFADLLAQKNENTFQIFTGIDDVKLFNKRASSEIEVKIPNDSLGDNSNIEVLDLNNDDRPDILMHHVSRTEPNNIVVLLSQED